MCITCTQQRQEFSDAVTRPCPNDACDAPRLLSRVVASSKCADLTKDISNKHEHGIVRIIQRHRLASYNMINVKGYSRGTNGRVASPFENWAELYWISSSRNGHATYA